MSEGGAGERSANEGGATTEAPERHATWLELFFDLVVVAGTGQLAHLLAEDSTTGGLGVYVVAFAAFWLVWACYTAYSSIVGDAVQVVTMLVGMACLGVMTAAVPQVHGEHARAFAIAYVVGRVVSSRPWHAGTAVVDLPVLQAAIGVLPWIASIWVDGEARYWLWALGLVLDLLLLVSTTRDRLVADTQRHLDRTLARVQQAGEERRRRAESRRRPASRAGARAVDPDRRPSDGPVPGGPRGRELPKTVQVAGVDLPHLAERLSLFVLIVLGESLIQVIEGASEATWDRRLAATALGAFLLIVGLWAVAVWRGYAGVALLHADAIAPRLAWVAHLVTTGALATMAAVVARLVEEPDAPVSGHDRWLILAAFAVYGLGSAAVHVALAVRAGPPTPARRVAAVRASCVGGPVLLALAVGALRVEPRASELVWTVAAGIGLVLLVSVQAGRRVTGTLPEPRL